MAAVEVMASQQSGSPKRKASGELRVCAPAVVPRMTATPQEAIGAEAMRMQRGVPPYDVTPLALYLAGLTGPVTVDQAQRAIAALQHEAALGDPDALSMLVVTDLCVRNTGTFVDTDDYLLMLALCHLLAKRALRNVRSLTIVLSARKKHGDCTTTQDVVALFHDELAARGISVVADAAAGTVAVRYDGDEPAVTVHVFQQLEQTVPSPLTVGDDGKGRKARAVDLTGPAFQAANDNICELNAALHAHVRALEGLVAFQCGPLDVPLAALLLERSAHIGSVSAGSGVNGGDGKTHDVDSSHRGGLLFDEAARAGGRVFDLKPQLTRRLRVTDFLVHLAGEKMARALATTVYRSFAVPYIERPTDDAHNTRRTLTLMLRLCDSNAQTTLDPDTFVEVVALCTAGGRVSIGDALRALGCTVVDPGAVLYAAWFALTCVTNILRLEPDEPSPATTGVSRLREVPYAAPTLLADILRAADIPAARTLTEGARAMVADSMPEHKLLTFGELFVAILVGMAGRLCLTLAVAAKCGVHARVQPTEPTLTEHGLHMSTPVAFGDDGM